jgi:hypothetical protein
MKCPKCGYVSYDYLDACRKCRRDLTEFKQEIGLQVIQPGDLDLSLVLGEAVEAMGDAVMVNEGFFKTQAFTRPAVSTARDEHDFDISLEDDLSRRAARPLSLSERPTDTPATTDPVNPTGPPLRVPGIGSLEDLDPLPFGTQADTPESREKTGARAETSPTIPLPPTVEMVQQAGNETVIIELGDALAPPPPKASDTSNFVAPPEPGPDDLLTAELELELDEDELEVEPPAELENKVPPESTTMDTRPEGAIDLEELDLDNEDKQA